MDSFTYSSGERLSAARKRKIIYVCGIVVGGVLLGTFLFWLINGRSFSSKKGDIVPDSCAVVRENERFNCHPDGNITEAECLRRGCCYKEASDLTVTDDDLLHSSYIGVPSCYFPKGYKGYSLKLTKNDDSIKGELTREKFSSGFIKDVKKVSLEVSYLNDNSLRIKLTDPSEKRYVSDLPLYTEQQPRVKPLYDVKIDNDGLLTVLRKSNSAIVFKTRLTQLIYSDQFLQLSTFVASTNFYGFGEHKDRLRRSFNWTRISQFNQGDLPVPHRNLYGSHPFYLIVEPDGSANGVYLRNTNAMDAILQPAPAVTLRPIGGILDFFIMLGPTPENVVSQYTGIIGRPFMIPYWSLGFQLCKYGYFTLNKTNETLQRNLDAGVPVDVQWHDIDYMESVHLDFTYDPEAFNGLDEWVNKLHDQGRKYIAMISPGVSNKEEPGKYPPYDKGKEKDLFLKDINGSYVESKVWNRNNSVYPDFSNPQTASYWLDNFKKFHDELDFDGVWLDMNEPLNFNNGSEFGCPDSSLEDPQYVPGSPFPLRTLTICMTSKHNKTEHYNEHNLVGFRESHATFDAMKEIRKKRPFLLSRATHAGQGFYSSHWSGDITSNWDDLRYTIPFTMVFNMYGMPMVGSDICGFRLNTSDELCARWQALGAFYPLSRNHNDFDTIEQDPAAMGGNVLEATVKALRTRYYLLPYFYYLFYRSHVFGETAVRPLFFEFPSDKTALDLDEVFLWGPALYVIPALYPGVNEVKAYFPQAVWYDFYNGSRITDKAEYTTLPANITTINLAVRGGYILPLQIPGDTVASSRENDFDVLIALNEKQEANGELYWDDGDSLDTYKNGAYDLNKFSANKFSFNNTCTQHKYPAKLNLNKIKVYGVNQEPKKITINGKEVKGFDYTETTLTINATGTSLKEDFTVLWV